MLAGTTLLAVAVTLAAANLRISVTSLSSVLGDVQRGLTAGSAWASAVTAAPSICFGLAALLSPWLARRIGGGPAIAVALAVLTAGLAVRVLAGAGLLLAGTFIACAGIAVCNVLVPVVVKESFPNRIGLVTGFYSSSMAAGSAVAAAVTPPLETAAGGWRPALAAWAIPAALALAVWLFGARKDTDFVTDAQPQHAARNLLRVSMAWVFTLLFSVQSIYAYVIMGWLPEILRDAGIGRDTAGVLLGVTMVIAVPLNLFVPAVAAKLRAQSGVMIGLTVAPVLGVLGLMFAPAFVPLLWAILLGAGMAIFPVVLTMMALRTRTSAETTQLSGMSQGFGYLIAAGGPFAAGLVYGWLGSWTVPLILVLGILAAQATLGAIIGRPHYI
ncbi:MFS transporter [Kutzneria kofuensis]|uniref:CP family cyanate transporter-like MFS transporter n=1 Tax=Kutzneria kofuensis TaxID=103725 RepID=A0A7W9KKK9_9PSEU|nr:MFS transporter [Kutzneria kofuensis]MBB5894160.1 CP family cyanate transporter-like MFS transporter [Kutzneria kofuensis]